MKYTDTHTHYNHRLFNKDRKELLTKLLNEDVNNIIECGTDVHSNKNVIKLCEQYDAVYGTIGFFPTNTYELEKEGTLEELEKQLSHKKIIGIGEIGLDYYHKGNPVQQKKWFIEQLKLAKKLQMPVCIHSRDAEADTLQILKNNGNMTGVIHCYAYGEKTMKELVKLGYYFGIGGTSTYKNNVELRKAIIDMPLNRIVLETDCPFLTPDTVRRERNDSSKIKYVIEELAKLKKVSYEDIVNASNENLKKLYPKMFQ